MILLQMWVITALVISVLPFLPSAEARAVVKLNSLDGVMLLFSSSTNCVSEEETLTSENSEPDLCRERKKAVLGFHSNRHSY
jgi:hypothetical protein